MVEKGLIILAAFNAIMLIMIMGWWLANCCSFTFNWVGCQPIDDVESEDSNTSSPPPFDRNRKPSFSILKNNNPQNSLADEMIDIEADPFVQAHRKLNNAEMSKPLDKRARFEEPPLM